MTTQTFRTANLIRILLALTVATFFSHQLTAQTLLPLSDNGNFSSGLSGWTATSAGATVINAGTGFGKAQLQGSVGLWQYQPVDTLSGYHMLNCQAYKSLQTPAVGQSPGWAGIGITYYDEVWGVIDTFEKQINVSSGIDAEGNPILVPCSLGVRVPPNAVHCIFWIANDPSNSLTVVDNLFLFDYFPYVYYTNNLGAHTEGTQPYSLADVFGDVHQTSGMQFWNIQGFIDIGNGTIGNAGSPSSISQEVFLVPGASYQLSWSGYSPFFSNRPVTNVGVDFFDSNWNRLGGTFASVEFNFNISAYGNQQIDVPSGAVHSILWLWVDALSSNDNNEQVPPMSFDLTRKESNPPQIAFAKPLPNLGPSATGLQFVVDYSDDQPGDPSVNSSNITLVTPNGQTYYFYYKSFLQGDQPGKYKIVFQAFSEVQWSQAGGVGTYTLTVPKAAIRDRSQNDAATDLITTFEVFP